MLRCNSRTVLLQIGMQVGGRAHQPQHHRPAVLSQCQHLSHSVRQHRLGPAGEEFDRIHKVFTIGSQAWELFVLGQVIDTFHFTAPGRIS